MAKTTHTGTIQNAVNALIREGLMVSFGTGAGHRIVRPMPTRSKRYGGFLNEFKTSKGHIEIAEIEAIISEIAGEDIDTNVFPLLRYKTLQHRDNFPRGYF